MSPKQQFLENKEDAKFLTDLTADMRFQRCIDFALLQYLENLSHTAIDGNHHFARLLGAQEFIRTLESLWTTAKPIKQAAGDNLDHTT